MSLRTSRRSQAAAAAHEDVPSVPISEIRVRKWTRQVKTVGHITIAKWVPDQEYPTEALQRGAFKKTKGRKRPVAEVGRMTRSVRQHLDAPLELLVEIPPIRTSTRSSAAATAVAAPTTAPAPAPAEVVTVPTAPPSVPVSVALDAPVATQPPPMASVSSAESLLGMGSDSMMFSDGVASEEQLEQALDDLPFLDTENLAMDPALALDRQSAEPHPAAQVPGTQSTAASEPPPVAQASPDAEASAESAEEQNNSSSSDSSDDDDDDDDDDDGTASVDSATPLPSPSPAPSPSPSPSP